MSDDSDVPEEFTVEEGLQQDEEIRKIQRENKARVIRERKTQRKKRAEKLTSQESSRKKSRSSRDEVVDESQNEQQNEPDTARGMLPNDIVELLAAKEKQVFVSDDEEEDAKNEHKPKKKKRAEKSGMQPVILKNIPPAHCLGNSLEFLKKRKTQVSRSSAVLNNSNKALRFLSNSGLLK